MLRKFKISIDGKEYLVEMEEIGGVTPQVPAPLPAAATPPPTPTPTAQSVSESTPKDKPKSTAAPAGSHTLSAPMPGTILKLLVNPGESVTANQPVMILEAMKMENEVVAPKAGTVTGIHVTQGQMVNPGEALITIG